MFNNNMSILKGLLSFPSYIFYYGVEARRCYAFTSKERYKIFCILISMQFRSIFQDSKGSKRIFHKIFGFDVYSYDFKTLSFLFREIFMSDEYNFINTISDPVIIDAGANIGMATLYFKYKFPTAKVISFEPNPLAFKTLEKNVEANKLQKVILKDTCLSDQTNDISFFIDDTPETAHGSIIQSRGGARKFDVKAELLSDYIKEFSPDFIKIDVEGSEIQIINDLVKTDTLKMPNQYIIEYHHNLDDSNSSFSEFIGHFEKAGFGYNIKATFLRIQGFQDILIHFYKKN